MILLKFLEVIKKNLFKKLFICSFISSSYLLKNNTFFYYRCRLNANFLRKMKREKNQNLLYSYKFSEIQLITIDLASPEKIKEWAEKKLPNGKIFGQVTNPNTLHYKTLKPLKGGLFCERIFGPIKDFECACGIHKQKPFNRIISFQNKQFCPKCDVEYTWSDIRRYQLGYIELVAPITHLWYLKGMPSYIRSVLGAKKKHIEAIAYCSEIITIDKAWKPNRFIPFPETISSVRNHSKIKKKHIYFTVENTITSDLINYRQSRKIQYLNKKLAEKKINSKRIYLKQNKVRSSEFLFKYFHKNFLKPNKFDGIIDFNPYLYKLENDSYKNKFYFYQELCHSFIENSLINTKSIYTLKFLHHSLSNSKVSFKIFKEFYKRDYILCLFNEEVFIPRFSNLYIFNKYNKYNTILNCMNTNKVHLNINKNLLYYKNKKLSNLELFNNSKLLTTMSNYFFPKKFITKDSKRNNLTFKMQFLKKDRNFEYEYLFLNHSILFYFNICSVAFLKNNDFFTHFCKLLTLNNFKLMKYQFFTIFLIPISNFIHNLIIKVLFDSQVQTLLKSTSKQNILNSDSLIIQSYKVLKKDFFIKNSSIYDEANEILWHKFWKTCHYLAYKKINQKLRKVINNVITETQESPFNTPSLLKFIKNLIKKTKIIKNLNFNVNNLKFFNKNKFSLFINYFKVYFKKTLCIYHLFPKSIHFKKTFFRFQQDLLRNQNLKSSQKKLKKIIIKLISLKLLPWILSQFIMTSKCFLKLKKSNNIFFQENVFRNNNQIQYNLIQKIKKNSFFNFNIQAKKLDKDFSKSFFYSSTLDYYKLKKIIEEFFIYKNQINYIIKHKKLKFFMNTWFLFFMKKYNNINKYFINYKFNNIKFNNIQSLKILFYQKKWLLKKKNILINYNLLRNLKYNFLNFFRNYKRNFMKLIYSSICKNSILISILSLQIKKFYKLNLIQNIQNYYHAIRSILFQYDKTVYSNFSILSSNNSFLKQLNYVYSFILFSSKQNHSLTNNRFFFNLFCFLKFAKKNILKKFSWLSQIQNNFYSRKILKYQKKQQKNSLLKFVQKKIFFYKFLYLIDLMIFHYRKKTQFIKTKSVMKLILQKKIWILFFVKKFQIKILNEIQKYYFYEYENKKNFRIKVNINNFKNLVIFMNAEKKEQLQSYVSFLVQSTTPVFYNKYKSDGFLNIRITEFLFISKFWLIIINLFKHRINQYYSLTRKLSFRIANKIFLSNSSIINFKKESFINELCFSSFLLKLTFSNIAGVQPLINRMKQKKKKILQTCEQYSKNLKLNNLFLIKYFKINWNYSKEINLKNKEVRNYFLFFRNYLGQYLISYNQSKYLTKNNHFVNFYLKFIKHDLNKTFNEAIFSVISESKKDSNDTIFCNNIYSLSNRYSWRSDVELNIFLCYMLSPENPSDILIPLYKKRIHSSNVLREEPPIAGGGIILKLLKELDLPEMKKIDIQLQTILKKIPNKLHEIEVLLKHYQTNIKFFKYYSLKRRTLIEIEKSILRKLKYIRRLNWVSAKPEYMIIRNLPVLPADLRPIFKIQQQLTASDLNRLYQKVIYRNDRLKRFLKNSTTSNSFEMFFAQRMLQEAVDNLIENGKDINSIEMDSRGRPLKSLGELLKGKKGRFRQNLLGKRVDYSGRSVIVVGPKLRLHECGLPIEMAIELFLPFLIKEILRNKYALTVRSAKLYIKKHRIEITQLLRQIVKRQPILLNRAPTLHRLGIQAFLPKLVEGKAILLHPLVCSAFNADFDGDQMAVHVPITNEARIEAWKLILSRNNLLSPATGEPILLPSQDMVLGCYYLTIDNSQSLLKKQKKFSGINQNKINNVFNGFETIFIAYQRNEIYLHTNVWVLFNDKIESDAILQKPTEIQVQFRGQYTKIYSDHYQKYNRKGAIYNQFIRTTPGRILFNLMLNDCLN